MLPTWFRVLSSPAARCRRLAERLHEAPRIDTRLREIDFGEWEMRYFSSIPRSEMEAWAADPMDFRPPGGETVREMQTRVVAALEELCATGKEAVALVTHGGPLRVIAGSLLNLTQNEWISLHFEYGCVSRIHIDHRANRLLWHNR